MSDYDYPRDEFDQAPAPGQPVGIHRAPQSAWSKAWPYLLVIVVFALLAIGLVAWFAQNSGTKTPTTPPPSATSSESTGAETSPEETSDEATDETPDDTTEPDDETSGDTSEPDGSDEPEDPDTTPELDHAVAVRVLNATNRAGLAAAGVNQLSAAGWTAATAANYTGDPISASAVWFKSEENRDEAEQIARDLRISSVSLQPALVGPVSVILASDFSG